MEESEKMTALKKAYAEIILNTAKEAAARVMVSERRAAQYENELCASKEEALRLLMRLKQMMDCKINEAEIKSLNQQRRIEELEAQLQEAEDVVSNLRAELNEAQVKLEELSKNKQQPFGEPMMGDAYGHETFPQDNGQSESASPFQAKITTSNQSNDSIGHFDANNSSGGYCYVGNSDVASIIMRSKEPELYRNGCTQRIRAFEGNFLNGNFSLCGQLEDLKNEKVIGEDKESERIHVMPVLKAEMNPMLQTSIGSKEVKEADKNGYKGQAFKSCRRKNRRAARYRRSKVSTLKSDPVRVTKALNDLSHSPAQFAGSDNNSFDEVPRNPSETGAIPECVAANGHDSELDKDMEVVDSLVLIQQDSRSAAGFSIPSSKPECEKINALMVNSDVKTSDVSDGVPSPTPRDKILKYTFQRKRKKESLSSENSKVSHEENTLRRKTGKNQNGSLEGPKSSLLAESSRDSRRMAQVARQLISLSEKKWWK